MRAKSDMPFGVFSEVLLGRLYAVVLLASLNGRQRPTQEVADISLHLTGMIGSIEMGSVGGKDRGPGPMPRDIDSLREEESTRNVFTRP
jgi:hypothetical protein